MDNRPAFFTDPSEFVADAERVLIYGVGNPAYVAPDFARAAEDLQMTWVIHWPREKTAWMNNTTPMSTVTCGNGSHVIGLEEDADEP